jgi:hypothetical protein
VAKHAFLKFRVSLPLFRVLPFTTHVLRALFALQKKSGENEEEEEEQIREKKKRE